MYRVLAPEQGSHIAICQVIAIEDGIEKYLMEDTEEVAKHYVGLLRARGFEAVVKPIVNQVSGSN